MKSSVLWDIMSCIPLEIICFGGIFLLHLQDGIVNQHAACSKPYLLSTEENK
jgi:hypothetical protein